MAIFNFGFLLTQRSPRARRGLVIEGHSYAWIEEGVTHVPHSRDALSRAKVAREDWLLGIGGDGC
jgi:hypothetical protein